MRFAFFVVPANKISFTRLKHMHISLLEFLCFTTPAASSNATNSTTWSSVSTTHGVYLSSLSTQLLASVAEQVRDLKTAQFKGPRQHR